MELKKTNVLLITILLLLGITLSFDMVFAEDDDDDDYGEIEHKSYKFDTDDNRENEDDDRKIITSNSQVINSNIEVIQVNNTKFENISNQLNALNNLSNSNNVNTLQVELNDSKIKKAGQIQSDLSNLQKELNKFNLDNNSNNSLDLNYGQNSTIDSKLVDNTNTGSLINRIFSVILRIFN